MQHIFSRQFAVTRGFGSGFWLALPYQGRGFDGLGGHEAYIGAWTDNPASLRVMGKFGYVFNGEYLQAFEGTARRDRRMRLPRETWDAKPRADIAITGLAPCLELFGLTDAVPRVGA